MTESGFEVKDRVTFAGGQGKITNIEDVRTAAIYATSIPRTANSASFRAGCPTSRRPILSSTAPKHNRSTTRSTTTCASARPAFAVGQSE